METGQKESTEKSAAGWSAELMELAKKFHVEMAVATRSTWTVAQYAFEMRSKFSDRAKKGEPGWTAFCQEVLKKNEATVSSYSRGYKYAAKWEPAKLAENPESLPPVSLVAELAACREDRRQELHNKLFGGYYSASEFRAQLVSVRDPEFLDEPDEHNDGDNQDGPKDRKTPKRSGAPGTGSKGKPKPQAFPKEKIAELFPATVASVQTFQAMAWSNVDELAEQVSVMLIDGDKRLDGWSIVLIPPKKSVDETDSETETEMPGSDSAATETSAQIKEGGSQ